MLFVVSEHDILSGASFCVVSPKQLVVMKVKVLTVDFETR